MEKLSPLESYLFDVLAAQPKWIQKLFAKKQVRFSLDDEEHLGILFKKKVSPLRRAKITTAILDWMELHPNSELFDSTTRQETQVVN